MSDLDSLIQGLGNLEGGLSSDPVVAASSYIIWTEKAERRLLETFESLAVPRALHSERYWRIRTTDPMTSRPMPLIYGEIRIQRIILEALRSQLSHYIKLVSFPEDQHILIPDTNVYIHGRLFHEVDWHREIGARRATLLMPLVVLDELDRVKDRDLTYGKRAGAVLRALDKLFKDSEWLAPKILRQGVSLQMVDEPLGHTRQLGQDDEIVRQASYFSQLNKNRLTVLTRDRGMRLRAQASGLIGKSLPVHLERIKEKDDE